MTILHKEEQPVSLKGVWSEHRNCIDCGINTNPGAPPRELAEFLMNRDGEIPLSLSEEREVYIVHDAVWKKGRDGTLWRMSLRQLFGAPYRAQAKAKGFP